MARRYSQSDGVIPTDLIHCGLDHIGAAKTLFDAGPQFFDSAGYLAHLGIEMLLKGWSLHVMGSFEGTHSLRSLYEQLIDAGQATTPRMKLVETLDRLDGYQQLRYPNLAAPVEVGNDDLDAIENLAGHICRSMPSELEEELAKINAEGSGKPVMKAGRMLMKKPIGE